MLGIRSNYHLQFNNLNKINILEYITKLSFECNFKIKSIIHNIIALINTIKKLGVY